MIAGRLKKIAFIATTEMPVNVFLKPHIIHLSRKHDVYIITNYDTPDFFNVHDVSVKIIKIPFERKVSFQKDIKCLFKLYKVLRLESFDIIISIMPKSGLLASIAGFFAKVNHRVHIFTGQVWANKKGFFRQFLKAFDKIICFFASDILTDSSSQLEFLVSESVVKRHNIKVLGHGSICGVDLNRFERKPLVKKNFRNKYGIQSDAFVISYLGRLNPDKGLFDFAKALIHIFHMIDDKNIFVIFAGPDEDGTKQLLQNELADNLDKILFLGYTNEPEVVFNSSDILVLPSYREGFGNVVIEAAACGLPCVGSDIYGLRDSISDLETGLLHKPGSPNSIATHLLQLIYNKKLLQDLGNNARERAKDMFSMDVVTRCLEEYILEITNDGKGDKNA